MFVLYCCICNFESKDSVNKRYEYKYQYDNRTILLFIINIENLSTKALLSLKRGPSICICIECMGYT